MRPSGKAGSRSLRQGFGSVFPTGRAASRTGSINSLSLNRIPNLPRRYFRGCAETASFSVGVRPRRELERPPGLAATRLGGGGRLANGVIPPRLRRVRSVRGLLSSWCSFALRSAAYLRSRTLVSNAHTPTYSQSGSARTRPPNPQGCPRRRNSRIHAGWFHSPDGE